jgi:hypothetical protein
MKKETVKKKLKIEILPEYRKACRATYKRNSYFISAGDYGDFEECIRHIPRKLFECNEYFWLLRLIAESLDYPFTPPAFIYWDGKMPKAKPKKKKEYKNEAKRKKL